MKSESITFSSRFTPVAKNNRLVPRSWAPVIFAYELYMPRVRYNNECFTNVRRVGTNNTCISFAFNLNPSSWHGGVSGALFTIVVARTYISVQCHYFSISSHNIIIIRTSTRCVWRVPRLERRDSSEEAEQHRIPAGTEYFFPTSSSNIT